MRNDIPTGTAGFNDVDELTAVCLKTLAYLLTVVGSLIGVGVGIGFLICG